MSLSWGHCVSALLTVSAISRKILSQVEVCSESMGHLPSTRFWLPCRVSMDPRSARYACRAFQKLKECLTTAPVLMNPDFQKPFILQTDASNTAIGAVLSQQFEDGEHPVAYLSKKLLPREQNYSTVEKELLAIVWAVGSLSYYLDGRKFYIETDHCPLSWLNRMKDRNQRLLRWSLLLQQYEFDIRYRKGKQNANADGMSRI